MFVLQALTHDQKHGFWNLNKDFRPERFNSLCLDALKNLSKFINTSCGGAHLLSQDSGDRGRGIESSGLASAT